PYAQILRQSRGTPFSGSGQHRDSHHRSHFAKRRPPLFRAHASAVEPEGRRYPLTQFSSRDLHFMRLALRLARKGGSRVRPNPEVSGRGARRLRQAGIRTAVGALEQECRTLNRPFLVSMEEQRPYVILKAAASLDGRITTAAGESKWITSPQARKAAQRMRAR